MAVAHKNLSHIKLDIQEIMSNLEMLENSRSIETNLNDFKTNTEDLLCKLESIPLERLRTIQKKRQKRRKNRILRKLKLDRNLEIKRLNSKCDYIFDANLLNVTHESPAEFAQRKRTIIECQRFLKTFELLQQLYLVRAQNPSDTYKFSLKLRKLKLIWNSLLQDKLQEQIPKSVKIQEQWNEILFGPSEHTYFEERSHLQEFIRKRQIWDSYVDCRYGSSIPIGWIIPPLKVNEKWTQYLKSSSYCTN